MRELVSALIDASPVPCVPVDDLELPATMTALSRLSLSKGTL